MFDGSFGRSLYLRYADDFVVLMANKLEEAIQFKGLITKFLKEECELDLNQEETTITNTRDGFQFLGA
jgi:retron-type reverse transcriptase